MLESHVATPRSSPGDVSVAEATSVLVENGLAPFGLAAAHGCAWRSRVAALDLDEETFAALPWRPSPAVPDERRAITPAAARSEHQSALENRIDDLERRLDHTQQELEKIRRRLALAELAANTDALTGIANRRRFEDVLAAAVVVARRFREPLSLLMVDVDHFKMFNDDFGHAVGDHVLRFVAGVLSQPWNEDSFAARYGGEEFAVLALRTTREEALERAEMIRRRVSRHTMIARGSGEALRSITISIGVAELGTQDTEAAVLRRADAALYAAKRAGRDRVMALRA